MRAFLKKTDLFNLFNAVMAVFCIAILSLNYIGCNVLSSRKLDCNIKDDKFSYLSKGNEIIVTKNDNFIGKIKFENHMLFRSSWKFSTLRCNAIILAGKIVAAGIAAAVAADAAIAEGGAAAVISSIVVPILIGAGVAAGFA